MAAIVSAKVLALETFYNLDGGNESVNLKINFNKKAIDDVCAWPKLTILPNGKVFAAIFNVAHHGAASDGDVEVWMSKDDGATWHLQGTPTKSDEKVSRYNHALGVTRKSELIVMSSGWSSGGDPNNINYYGGGRKKTLLNSRIYISSDEGKNWTTSTNFPVGPQGIHLIPFGNIEAGLDGNLRVSAYSFQLQTDNKPRIDNCFCLKSIDDGISWEIDSVIGNFMQNETDIAYVGQGKWLAASRILSPCQKNTGHRIELFVSEDDTRTWRSLGPITGYNEHPGDLLVLKDGRIVLTYGNRNTGEFGVYAKISHNQGKNWSEPVLLTETLNGDSGYPSSAELSNGRIITVYYAKGTKFSDNYQMGAVQWEV